jgi:hypothetical protein
VRTSALCARPSWQPLSSVAVVMSLALGGTLLGASLQQPPVLRAGVDLLTIDVQVSPAGSAPMRELTGADFKVRISGRLRPIASAAFLHYDDGPVMRSPPRNGAPSTCVFGFNRRSDRATAHYVLAVERSAADQAEVKQVQIELLDKTAAIQWVAWRSPVRKAAQSGPPLRVLKTPRPPTSLD